jgi:hypothetical protein
MRCRFGLPKDLLSDREITPLFLCKVLCDQFTAGTTKIVDAVGPVLSDIYFPVRVGKINGDVGSNAT